jgi:hypothetical protein
MPSTLPRQTPRRIAFTVFALAYLLGGALVLAYGSYTHTGLSGWLMNQQMRYFGGADSRLTLLGNALVWALSLIPIFYALVRLNRAEGFTPVFPGQQPPVEGQPALTYAQHQAQLYSPRSRAITALVVVVVAVGAFLYFTWSEHHLINQPVARLNLNQAAALPAHPELATVRGVLAANYRFVLEETGSSRVKTITTYAPLLPASWQPGQPVQFLVKTKIPVYQNPSTGRVFLLDSGQVFPATYDGRLSANDAPTYVLEYLTERHLTLAAPYYVLDDEEMAGGHVTLPHRYYRWLALGLGLFVALAVLVRKQPGT